MQLWEHRVVTTSDTTMEECISEMEQRGWELIQVVCRNEVFWLFWKKPFLSETHPEEIRSI